MTWRQTPSPTITDPSRPPQRRQRPGPGLGVRAYETFTPPPPPQAPLPTSLPMTATPTPAGAVPPPVDPLAALDASTPGGDRSALGQSGAYLAFMRALGLSDATDAAKAQVTLDALNRRAGLRLEDVAAGGASQRQSIADTHETRGTYRSGSRLRAQAASAEDQARQGSQVAGETADQTASLVAELAERRAQRQRELAERSYSTAADVFGGGV